MQQRVHSGLLPGRPNPNAILVTILLLVAGCGDAPDTAAPDPKTLSPTALRDALRKNPDDASLRLQLARLYLQQGDGATAESYLRRALAGGTSDPRAAGDLVHSLLLQDKRFEALEMLAPLLERSGPDGARLWMLRAEALRGQSSSDERKIRQAFFQAFQRLAQDPDPATASQLDTLVAQDPVVAAARDHFDCASRKPELIDPPAAEDPVVGRRVLSVGPGRELKTPSQAARVAADGDLIEIDAGVYRGDVAVWTQNDITLRGVGGIAQLQAAGRHADGKAIWVFEGDAITAENIGFSGARVPHRNGAGIRLQGRGATIRNCRFTDNENGILGGTSIGNVPGNDVLVEFSVFERNGHGDGLSHNIYVGRVRSFTLRYSYSFASNVGHLVKSRAHENAILFNRIVDGKDGNASYVINLPEGGRAWIVGNEMQQGPAAQNPTMISFGEEFAERKDQALYVVNNTFYNNVLDGTYVRNATTAEAVLANNIFAGAPAVLLRGPGSETHGLRQPGPWFVDAAGFDFRLTAAAPAIDSGLEPAGIAGLRFLPDAEYRHPARGQKRMAVASVDMGAREFCRYD